MERLITENYTALANAVKADFTQGDIYIEAFELGGILSRVQYTKSNLKLWMKTQSKPTPFPVNLNIPVHTTLSPNPRGVVLIITPWNMPITMTLSPLLEALAAGNVCILKMSEKSVHVTQLLTELLRSGRYVDERAVHVVNGGAEVATELLKYRFDAISYTGGTYVGRIVNMAAARHITPTLLELGGKNPVFVTRNAHIASAAMRIAWGKISANTGQMCICPDYVLVERCVKDEFVMELCKAMDQFYPVSSYSTTTSDRGDVGKMISVEHAERVVSMLDSTCKVIYGGKHHDTKDRFVAPTIVEADENSTIMKDEIFGPILAIVTVEDVDGAIEYVNTNYTFKGEHPLNLYIFTKSKEEQQRIMKAVPSSVCAINDVIKQSGNIYVPFGGIGTSGMGQSYGKSGFDFFSHYRQCLVVQNYSTFKWDPAVWMLFPPYDDNKLFLFRCLCKFPLIGHKLKRIVPPVAAKLLLPVALGMFLFTNPSMLETILELNLKTILGWIVSLLSSRSQ